MSMENILGANGEPVRCKVITDDISVHWFETGAKTGDKCLCGETERSDEEAELDNIVVDNSLDVIFDKMGYTKNTDFRKEAIRLITDWHNKQIEAVLDRLTVADNISDRACSEAIQAERNKLKER